MNFPGFRTVAQRTRVFSKICHSKGLIPCNNVVRPPILPVSVSSQRLVSTVNEVKAGVKETGVVQRLLRKIPFLNIDRIKAQSSGYFLYENVVDKLDYLEMFNKYDLPDTFYSWFAITELHVWMMGARVMAEGDLGHLIRNALVEALWTDVAKRTKKLGDINPSALKAQVRQLSEQLQAAFIAYDEGLQSDDIVLASAIWRRMYQGQYASPHHIEDIVRYIRKHMALLDSLSKEQIMEVHPIKWEFIHK